VTFGLKREIDQHDAVLLHNADQENNPDQPDDVELTSGSSIALPRSFWPSGSAPGTARGSDRQEDDPLALPDIVEVLPERLFIINGHCALALRGRLALAFACRCRPPESWRGGAALRARRLRGADIKLIRTDDVDFGLAHQCFTGTIQTLVDGPALLFAYRTNRWPYLV
jgi:hypothetical protein